MSCFLMHNWGKWEQYVENSGTAVSVWGKAAGQEIPYTDKRQKRKCKRCNKAQDRLVK